MTQEGTRHESKQNTSSNVNKYVMHGRMHLTIASY